MTGPSISELTYHSPAESVAILLRTTLSLLQSYAPGIRQEASLRELEHLMRRTIDDLEHNHKASSYELACRCQEGI